MSPRAAITVSAPALTVGEPLAWAWRVAVRDDAVWADAQLPGAPHRRGWQEPLDGRAPAAALRFLLVGVLYELFDLLVGERLDAAAGAAVAQLVARPGAFQVLPAFALGHWLAAWRWSRRDGLVTVLHGPDRDTGRLGVQLVHQGWRDLAALPAPDQRAAFREAVLYVLDHEVCEALHADGVRVFDPHREEA